MSSDTEELDERTKWTPWAIAAAAVLVLLFGVIAFGTLRGCFYVDPEDAAKLEEEKKKEEEKKEKAEFNISPPVVLPSEAETPVQPVKPGHWVSTSQRMRANYRNFVGDSKLSIVNRQEKAYAVGNTPFVLRASRPVLLAKGRPKATESTLFIPQTDQSVNLATTLQERSLGFAIGQPSTRLTRMPSYQYHFVVLANEPTRYSFIKSLDSVKVPFDGETDADDTEDPLHYRVVQSNVSQTIQLPDNPLTWTGIAYLLWDEVDPQSFTPEQERALVDWLHWGGQMIVSGPDSLDLLKGSFLEPYMPAANGGKRTFAPDDSAIAELNSGWMISTTAAPGEPLKVTAPWSGITLDIHADARALPNTGELLVERQVGRGRIVVAAMQLAERDLINWRSGFGSLFNACLLRRPPREYRSGFFGDVTLAWADEALAGRRLDARLTTNLRYFARDLGVDTAYRFEDVRDPFDETLQFNERGEQEIMREYRAPEQAGGIGAWNDFNATANAAREALREAAGVEVPGAAFVVLCLAAYLIALVPLNWLVFHTVGRVEWAWVAAPLIAIVGTFVVVHQAQLDIGFVRAQTEIGLLEQQPDHPRAHLSRYTALYTSLSTTYDLAFGNMTTVAAPFPADDSFSMLRGQGLQDIDFQRYDDVRLAGLPISSNSTGMVHSEQMLSLDGAIRLGQSAARGGNQLENRTKLAMESLCVVRRPLPDDRVPAGVTLYGKWIGTILPGQSTPISLQRIDPNEKGVPFARERRAEQQSRSGERLNLEPMFRLALDPKHMEPGETRLVARVDELLPGQEITPGASQINGATLVVAHLGYAPLPPPRPDKNTRQDIKAKEEDPAEAEQFEF
jgi:hypothetical protein